MRKLFFTLCFTSTLILSNANAAVRSIVEIGDIEKTRVLKPSNVQRPEVIIESENQLEDFIKDRLKVVVVTPIEPEEFDSPTAVNIIPSDEHFERQKEESKPIFQKIYENALARSEAEKNKAMAEKKDAFSTTQIANEQQEKQKKQFAQKDYPKVKAKLPNGETILVPAIEHIPYFFTNVDLMADGAARISEKIIVVANGEKLENGLSKALPKYTIARDRKKSNLDIRLEAVKINGKEIEYKIEDAGEIVIISPKKEYILEPGVYTYEFDYIVIGQLWKYDDFKEFHWNVTGNYWNLIVARTGATINMPGNKEELGRMAFINRPSLTKKGEVNIMKAGDNVLGFGSRRPLYPGESFQFMVSMPNENFIEPPLNVKINGILNSYGDIILATLAAIAIIMAYFVSWIFINQNKTKNNTMQKAPTIMRYLIKGEFDKRAYGAFILDLYRKKIIDIQESDKEITLVRMAGSTDSLSRKEKDAINAIFAENKNIANIKKENEKSIKKAYEIIKDDTIAKVRNFVIKANAGYIIFSAAMMILAQIGIAVFAYSPIKIMLSFLALDIMIIAAMIMIKIQTKIKYKNVIAKLFAIILLISSVAAFAPTIHLSVIVITITTIAAVTIFTSTFSKRNGLISSSIKEAVRFKNQIQNSVETISQQRNFWVQQPNIYAFELEQLFESSKDKAYYKIALVNKMLSI